MKAYCLLEHKKVEMKNPKKYKELKNGAVMYQGEDSHGHKVYRISKK